MMRSINPQSEVARWRTSRLALGRLLAQETPSIGEPRRRHTRYGTRHLQVESPVYGWVVNVSESGLRLESLQQLATGAEHVFRLRYGASFLNLPGRVVWSRLTRTQVNRRLAKVGVFEAGIELADGASSADWIAALERLTGIALRA